MGNGNVTSISKYSSHANFIVQQFKLLHLLLVSSLTNMKYINKLSKCIYLCSY